MTPFSASSLRELIPDWLGSDLLDPAHFHLPAAIPPGGAMQLREAAQRFKDALMQRSSHDERNEILGELRLRTATRNENVEEARARFRLLRADCERLPTDVLREAVKAYAESNKFFPVGFAELAPYVNRAKYFRSARAHHLERLAGEAEHALAEKARLEADPLTPEAIDQIKAQVERELGRPCESLRAIEKDLRPLVHSGPPRKPTRQDYIDMGVDPAVLDGGPAEEAA